MRRALDFYTNVLGLAVISKSDDWSELDCNGAVIGLHSGAKPGQRSTGLSFSVDDIDLACAQSIDGGATVLNGPFAPPGEPIRLAEMRDPEGNYFMFSQWVG
jgi:predicted enzyme related to lactoylglutathione lyase